MAFNVADFRAQISSSKFGGLALANKFIVRITPPSKIAQAASIAGVINTIKRPRNIQDLINQGTTIRTLGRGLGVF
jgi:hypothetical protein